MEIMSIKLWVLSVFEIKPIVKAHNNLPMQRENWAILKISSNESNFASLKVIKLAINFSNFSKKENFDKFYTIIMEKLPISSFVGTTLNDFKLSFEFSLTAILERTVNGALPENFELSSASWNSLDLEWKTFAIRTLFLPCSQNYLDEHNLSSDHRKWMVQTSDEANVYIYNWDHAVFIFNFILLSLLMLPFSMLPTYVLWQFWLHRRCTLFK